MHALSKNILLCNALGCACFEGYHIYSDNFPVCSDIICIIAFRKSALEAQLLDLCFISGLTPPGFWCRLG